MIKFVVWEEREMMKFLMDSLYIGLFDFVDYLNLYFKLDKK